MATTEKRVLDEQKPFSVAPVVILDIEGTTTSISFVKDTLFPYVRENVEKYVKDNWANEEFKSVLKELIAQAEKDVEAKVEGVVILEKDQEDEEKAQKAVVANVLWQMDSDRKTSSLKLLQGHIYREGYKSGQLKGHIFPDVAMSMKKWKGQGKQVYIYSSGSVEAQKLLFGHTTEGDLLEFLAGYFDTEVGAKGDTESYKKIAEKIGKKPDEMVFYTDIVAEAEAAKKAGMFAVLMKREGNGELSEEAKTTFPVLEMFLEEDLEEQSPAKKIKVDKEGDVEMEEIPEKTEEIAEDKKTEVEEKKVAEEAKAEDLTPKEEEPPKSEDKTEIPVEEEPAKSEVKADTPVEAEVPATKVEEEPKVIEALEAPPKVEAIEHKPEESKPMAAESNGTIHVNGKTAENGTNGVSDKTNGVSDDKKTNGSTEEKSDEVVKSPSKKIVIDAAGDAPEVTAAE